MRLLVIEDDERVASFLQRGLRDAGYAVEWVADGRIGRIVAEHEAFAVVLLDLVLPGTHGIEVCRELRAAGSLTPILMLTAADGIETRVTGLRAGADDYLAKPFAFDELLARIEALIRRSQRFGEAAGKVLRVADIEFDLDALRVSRAGVPVRLTATELALLELLMSAPGSIISRSRILSRVWGSAGEEPQANVVDVYIRRLRLKLDAGRATPLIKTAHGIGYRMDEAPL